MDEQRIRVVITQNTPINSSDGHFEIEYPNAYLMQEIED